MIKKDSKRSWKYEREEWKVKNMYNKLSNN